MLATDIDSDGIAILRLDNERGVACAFDRDARGSTNSPSPKRVLVTAAVAALGAGAVVGLIAFGFDDASPQPTVSTVTVPGYYGQFALPETPVAPIGQTETSLTAIPTPGAPSPTAATSADPSPPNPAVTAQRDTNHADFQPRRR